MDAAACQAQSVSELAVRSLAADPAVSAAQAQWRAAEERVVQARAAFGPNATASYNNTKTHYADAPAFEDQRFQGRQAAVQVTQPLWHSALFPALDAARAQFAQAEAALEQAQAESLQRLVEACFDVLKARDLLSLTQAQRVATAEQLASAQRSYTVGTAAITDVREAEAKADTVTSQLEAAQFDLELKRQVLAEITGMPVTDLDRRGLAGDRLPALAAPELADWLAKAFAQNPQIRQTHLALTAAEAEALKAAQGHAPTADLSLNYTVNRDNGSVTNTSARRYNSSQVGVSISIPLFASGATQSKVRESLALRDKALSDVDNARRTVTIGVRQNFLAVLSALSQVRGMETAVRSQEASLKANRRGYEVGMKVNAEVLDTQSRLFEARRDLSKARYDAWLGYLKLKAMVGELRETDAVNLDGLLVVLHAEAPEGPRRRNGAP